jgi:hypothetical protein
VANDSVFAREADLRIKIIAVNALIVALVGLLAFLLVRSSLSSVTGNKDQLTLEAQNDVNGAAGRLQLDGLRAERWLAGAATEPATLDALSKATLTARGEAATKRADDLVSRMKNEPLFEKNVPTLVAFVDTQGRIIGRNGTNMSRGDSIGTYAGLNDTLSRVSEATTGRALDVVVASGDSFEIVGNSATRLPQLDDAIGKSAKDMLKNSLAQQQTGNVRDGDYLIAASTLPAFADGKRALLVAAAPASLIQDPTGLAMLPIFGAMAVGLILVIVGGMLLGNYITRPINMLEEGLLAILNGQADKRFELEHAELGGLAFRIDQLLNQLMGVEEDTTDAEGRVSMAPNAGNFSDALAVDTKQAAEQAVDPAAAASLAAEPPAQYYSRIYREYITAKRALGEATDHITEQAFAQRIQGMEQDAHNRSGKRVRYQVHARNKEVVLIAVPLP